MHKIFSLLFFIICINACYKESEYIEFRVNAKDLIHTTLTSDTIMADGKSSSQLRITLPENVKDEFDTIRVSINNGLFSNGSNNILIRSYLSRDSINSKIGVTDIISSQRPGLAIIKVQVGGYDVYDTIYFKRSYPEFISTNLSSLFVSYGYSTVKITTQLGKDHGKPSENTTVDISATDKFGKKVGLFLNKDTIANFEGIIMNEYALGKDSCFCDKVYIVTRTLSQIPQQFKVQTDSLIVN